jgi:hypothetical protein
MAGGKAGKDSGKSKQKAVSRSARAGLQFPVGRSVKLHALKNVTRLSDRLGHSVMFSARVQFILLFLEKVVQY